MPKFILRCLQTSVVAFVVGCGASTTEAIDPSVCPQTYEFGNFGCARVVVLVSGPSEPLPVTRRWYVGARLLTANNGMIGGFDYSPGPGSNLVEFTRMMKMPAETVDTFAAWVGAKVFDETVRNVPTLPVFAADSVLHVFKFAPVGARPVVDTVRLTLRR